MGAVSPLRIDNCTKNTCHPCPCVMPCLVADSLLYYKCVCMFLTTTPACALASECVCLQYVSILYAEAGSAAGVH